MLTQGGVGIVEKDQGVKSAKGAPPRTSSLVLTVVAEFNAAPIPVKKQQVRNYCPAPVECGSSAANAHFRQGGVRHGNYVQGDVIPPARRQSAPWPRRNDVS